jgi:hypothetical protein
MNVTIIIPTKAERMNFLQAQLLEFSKSKLKPKVLFVCSLDAQIKIQKILPKNLDIGFILDPGRGVVYAINAALERVDTTYWNWCGDDDLLDLKGVAAIESALNNDMKYVFGFGKCEYIDKNSLVIHVNKYGRFAEKLIQIGPNLIAQPAALFRTEATRLIGGLNPNYQCAFDQDFIQRLNLYGKFKYVDKTVAKYRWHGNSLTSINRFLSLRESYEIRKKFAASFHIKVLVRLAKYPTYCIVSIASWLFSRSVRE